jgi:hypothetical protein
LPLFYFGDLLVVKLRVFGTRESICDGGPLLSSLSLSLIK